MPKNPKLNIDRYKVAGGELNEYEFQQNQQALAEHQQDSDALIPGTPPEARESPQAGGKVEELVVGVRETRAAKKSPAKKAAKGTKKATKKSTKKAGRKADKASNAPRTSKTKTRATAKSTKSRKAAKKRGTKKAVKKSTKKRSRK